MTYIFDQKQRAKRPPRRAERIELQANEAEKYALSLLRDGKISPLESHVIDLLAVAGVLSDSQIKGLLSISTSSLLRYYKNHLIDRVLVHDLNLERFGFKKEKVYALGMVGIAIAEMRAEGRPVPKGYIGYGVNRVAHDMLVNEVVIRLSTYARGRGYAPLWRSRYEATVRDNMGVPKLEPDALLEIGERQFVLEYHNEDASRRAVEKVERYERVRSDGYWRDSWQTDTLPVVLVAFTHKAVATGYHQAIESSTWRNWRFLGKPWASFRRGDNPALWQDFRTGKVVNILD